MSDEQFSLRNFVGNLLSLAQRPPPNGVWAEAVSQFSGIDHVAVTENNNASRSNVSGTSSSPSANADVQPIANAMSAQQQPEPGNIDNATLPSEDVSERASTAPADSNVLDQVARAAAPVHSPSSDGHTTPGGSESTGGRVRMATGASLACAAGSLLHHPKTSTVASTNCTPSGISRSNGDPIITSSDTTLEEQINPSSPLYDHPERYRFPNGPATRCYEVDDPKAELDSPKRVPRFATSWPMYTYSPKGKVYYQSCLGVYCCPVEGCQYIDRGSYPSGPLKKHKQPTKPNIRLTCPVHNKPVEHESCSATCVLTKLDNGKTRVKHMGTHHHRKPHEKKPSQAALKALRNKRKLRPDSKPRQLVIGDDDVKSTRQVHPSLGNSDRVAHYISQIDGESKRFTLEDIRIDGVSLVEDVVWVLIVAAVLLVEVLRPMLLLCRRQPLRRRAESLMRRTRRLDQSGAASCANLVEEVELYEAKLHRSDDLDNHPLEYVQQTGGVDPLYVHAHLQGAQQEGLFQTFRWT